MNLYLKHVTKYILFIMIKKTGGSLTFNESKNILCIKINLIYTSVEMYIDVARNFDGGGHQK